MADQAWIAVAESMTAEQRAEVDGLVNAMIGGLRDGESLNMGDAYARAVGIVADLSEPPGLDLPEVPC